MQLSAISLAITRPGLVGFDPAGLFSGSVEGVWYDPSDTATLFQDSAGTTPVTAVEQPVGRMLDKSGRGNHAFQTTSTSRPVLSARYNLLTKTEQFDDAAWTKTGATVTPNSVTAPDGTLTADALVEDGTTGNHWVFQTVGTTASHLSSVYLKAGSRSWAALRVTLTGPVVSYAYFDLANGVVGSVASGLTASITSVGNGWYRCTIAGTLSGSIPVVISAASADGVISYAGNNNTALYLWGADLRVTNDAAGQPAYQRVNTATDYDTTGFKPYLRFDGTDDWLQTNSINFTGTDKMTVFAGVRKLSDAARGILVELSASAGTNAGAFLLSAPEAASASFGAALSTGGTARTQSFATYAAPFSAVLVQQSDGSKTSIQTAQVVRVNGAVATSADIGALSPGNFGNYPLYIGRRAGTTLPFNGRIYGLIVRGAQSTAQQITNTENWLNQRTGAF